MRGRIGSFDLQLNWAKMQSVPVIISVSQVHVLLRPRRQRQRGGRAAAGQRPHDWTAEEVKDWMEREKQRALEAAFAQSAALFAEAASSASPSSFAASFLASVVDNLQVRVEDVHVCVEGRERRRETSTTASSSWTRTRTRRPLTPAATASAS